MQSFTYSCDQMTREYNMLYYTTVLLMRWIVLLVCLDYVKEHYQVLVLTCNDNLQEMPETMAKDSGNKKSKAAGAKKKK